MQLSKVCVRSSFKRLARVALCLLLCVTMFGTTGVFGAVQAFATGFDVVHYYWLKDTTKWTTETAPYGHVINYEEKDDGTIDKKYQVIKGEWGDKSLGEKQTLKYYWDDINKKLSPITEASGTDITFHVSLKDDYTDTTDKRYKFVEKTDATSALYGHVYLPVVENYALTMNSLYKITGENYGHGKEWQSDATKRATKYFNWHTKNLEDDTDYDHLEEQDGVTTGDIVVTYDNVNIATTRPGIFDPSIKTYFGCNIVETSSDANGGAIYNYEEATIESITGDFLGNYAKSEANEADGGAIYNDEEATIESITGDFLGNYASGSYGAYGGAIYNYSTIGTLNEDGSVTGGITGDFLGNYASSTSGYARGGAIFNEGGEIGDITGDFLGNYAEASGEGGFVNGGAIYSDSGATIGNITGDFLGNYAEASGEGGYAFGGAIYSGSGATIGNITGDFLGNYAEASGEGGYAFGGAIYNYSTIGTLNEDGSVTGGITGDFLGNYASSTSGYARGGAIYNEGGEIGDITGDFLGNYAEASGEGGFVNGGAIYSDSGATIGNITGDFLGNYASGAEAFGGAIYNEGQITEGITGDFLGNYASGANQTGGGAITNTGTITSITGDFLGNYAQGNSFANGGAIYNNFEATIGSITGDFLGNYAEAGNGGRALGGAIANRGYNIISIVAKDGDDVLFSGNKVSAGTGGIALGGAIFNYKGSTVKLYASAGQKITFVGDENDASVDSIHNLGTIYINGDGGTTTDYTGTVNLATITDGIDPLGEQPIIDPAGTMTIYNGTVNVYGSATQQTVKLANKNATLNLLGAFSNIDTIEGYGIVTNNSIFRGKLAQDATNKLYFTNTGTWRPVFDADHTSNNTAKVTLDKKEGNTNGGVIDIAYNPNGTTDYAQKTVYDTATVSDLKINDGMLRIQSNLTQDKADKLTVTNLTLGDNAKLKIQVMYDPLFENAVAVEEKSVIVFSGNKELTPTLTVTGIPTTFATQRESGSGKDVKIFTPQIEIDTSDSKNIILTGFDYELEEGVTLAKYITGEGNAAKFMPSYDFDVDEILTGDATTGSVTEDTRTDYVLNMKGHDLTTYNNNNGITVSSGKTLKVDGKGEQESQTVYGTISGFNTALKVDEGGTLNISNVTFGSSNTVAISNSGTVTLSGTNTFDSAITGTDTATTTNNGTLNISASNLDVALTNTGTVNLAGGELKKAITGAGTTQIAGTVTNDATITQSAVSVASSGVFTNNTGKVTVTDFSNAGTATISMTDLTATNISNTGELNLDGTLSQAISGTGTTKVNETMTLGEGASVAGTLNLNGGTVTMSGDNATTAYEVGTLAGSGSITIDVDATEGNNKSDSFTITNAAQEAGSVTVSNITLLNGATKENVSDFSVKVLDGGNANLTLTEDLKDAYHKEDTEEQTEDITETVAWNKVFHVQERTITRDIDVARSVALGIYDTIKLATVTGEWQDKASLGDTLDLINNLETANEKTFSFEGATAANNSYTLTTNLTTTKGVLNINGVKAEDNLSTIDLGSNTGFSLDSDSTLKISNAKITGGADNTAITNDGGTLEFSNEVTMDSKITGTGSATNAGTLNISADNLDLSLANTGTVNLGDGTLEKSITGAGTTEIAGTVTNDATITQSAVSVANAGVFTNNTGKVTVTDFSNAGTATISMTDLTATNISNTGKLNLDGELSQAISGTGTTKVSGTMTLRDGASVAGTFNLNSGTVTMSGDSKTTAYEVGTLAGTGNVAIDINTTGTTPLSDSFTISNPADTAGNVTVSDITLLGGKTIADVSDFEVKVLNGGNTSLAVSDALKTAYYKTFKEYKSDDITPTVQWDDTFSNYERTIERNLSATNTIENGIAVGKLRLATAPSTDWILSSTGDTLNLLNNFETTETKNFNFDDASNTYALTTDLATTKGTLNINGVKTEDNLSTINLGSYTGFSLDSYSTLKISNAEITGGADNTAITNNGGTLVFSNEVTMDSKITGTGSATNVGTLNISASNLGMALTNKGTLNLDGGKLAKQVSATDGTGTIDLKKATEIAAEINNQNIVLSGNAHGDGYSTVATATNISEKGNNLTFNGGGFDFTNNGKTASVADYQFNNINLATAGYLKLGVDLAKEKMDTLNVNDGGTVKVNEKLHITALKLLTDAKKDVTTIAFTENSDLAKATVYEGEQELHVESHVQKYTVAYNDESGEFTFTKVGLPEASETTKSISDTALAINMAWLETTNNLQKRLGDLRSGEASNTGWARFQRNLDDLNNGRKLNVSGNLYQIGYDFALKNDTKNRSYLGLSLEHFDGNQSFNIGGGDIKSTTLGAYYTKIYDSGHYFDFIFRYGRYESDTTSYDASLTIPELTKLDYALNGVTLSGEYGYRANVGKSGLYIEPQAELIYGYLGGASKTSSTGVLADIDSTNHFVSRFGVALGQKVKNFNYYLRGSYYHDFAGSTNITYGDTSYKQDSAQNWWEVSLGGGWNLSNNSYIYAEFTKHFKDVSNSLNFNLGFRFTL